MLWCQMRQGNPIRDGVPRLIVDLELDRPLGLPLHDYRTGGYITAEDHIVDAQPN